MDTYTFIAELVKAATSMVAAFAWPVGLFGIVWLFRKRLNELLPLLIFKYKDWQISFGLDKAEKDAKRIPAPPQAKAELLPAPDVDEKQRLKALAEIAPRAAILEARSAIEKAVNEFAKAIRLAPNTVQYHQTVHELRRNELIDMATVDLLNELRQIGNAAAHNMTEPTESEALRYQELAYQVIRQFQIATGAANIPMPGPITDAAP